MKEGYSQIRNEALAYAFSYMNLIEHWGSGIPRIINCFEKSSFQNHKPRYNKSEKMSLFSYPNFLENRRIL